MISKGLVLFIVVLIFANIDAKPSLGLTYVLSYNAINAKLKYGEDFGIGYKPG